ncbi:CBO2463/CBO2479 domain-containing protein [Fusibacter sp. JL216-2]|uniref:CBO2463/CBO2479 domain-containing protein n=1 Tax=Fusibacter sp. JL216-2 TaxID=3071453 RepID=UPI003D32E81B
MRELKYQSNPMYMEGIIVAIQEGAVTMDLKGRLGTLKVPRRMLISDYELQLGQEVGFMMGHPEVVSAEPCEQYVNNQHQMK